VQIGNKTIPHNPASLRLRGINQKGNQLNK